MSKATKENFYKAGATTLANHMTLSPKKPMTSLEENLKHLRDLLSVDPILYDVNAEEALEFLDAIEADFASEKQELEDALKEADSEVNALNDFNGLFEKIKELDEDDILEKLLDHVMDQDEDLVYDRVKSQGFMYIKVNNLKDQMKVEEFLTKDLYPFCSDQQKFIM